MSWNIISKTTEKVVDKNPDIYVKRAERELSFGNVSNALAEIDTALKYCSYDTKNHYIVEKIKVLYAGKRYNDCCKLILDSLNNFYYDFDLYKFKKVLKIIKNTNIYNDGKLKSFLKERNIPWVLIDELNVNNNNNNYYYYFENMAVNHIDKNPAAALEYCDVAIKLNENNSKIYFIKAYCYELLHEYNYAISNYDKCISLNSTNSEAYNNKAIILYKTGKYSEALKCNIRACQLSPESILFINNKALTLMALKNYKEAESSLLETRKIPMDTWDKEIIITYYYLGQVYDNLKKYRKANYYYKKVLSLDSSYDIPFNEERNKKLKAFKIKITSFCTLASIAIIALVYYQYYLFSNGIINPIVTNVQIEKSNNFVEVGQSITLKEKHDIFPPYGVDLKLKFVTDDNNVAEISEDGTLLGKSEGRSTIYLMQGGKNVGETPVNVVDKIADEQNNYYSIEYVDGQGVYTDANYNKYIGEMKDNKWEGPVSVSYANGETYNGELKGLVKNGQGTFVDANGNEYVGDFVDDEMDGYGVLTFKNGDVYEGEFHNGYMHGQGKFVFGDDGSTIVAKFHYDDITEGTFTYSNGDVYIGEFKNGQRDGYGTYYFADGEIIEGYFGKNKLVRYVE